MEYNTPFRTTLRNEERDEIKRIANEKGMKLTGYVDYILRRAIEEERRSSGRKQLSTTSECLQSSFQHWQSES